MPHRATQSLPDALRGERWAFVQLPLSSLSEMLAPVEEVCGCTHVGRQCGCYDLYVCVGIAIMWACLSFPLGCSY